MSQVLLRGLENTFVFLLLLDPVATRPSWGESRESSQPLKNQEPAALSRFSRPQPQRVTPEAWPRTQEQSGLFHSWPGGHQL